MSAHNNALWHDGHLYAPSSSSSSSNMNASQSSAAFDPLSGAFIHASYPSTSESCMHVPLLAQHMGSNGGPTMDSMYGGSVRLDAPFHHSSMALGDIDNLEALQRRLMDAATTMEGSDEMKNRALLQSSMLSPSIATMQQQQQQQQQQHTNQHLYHQQALHQQHHHSLHGSPSHMPAQHPVNTAITMPWATAGTPYSFTSHDRGIPNNPYEVPNIAPPTSLNGHAAAAMSLLGHTGNATLDNMHTGQRLSLPSSPALIDALKNANHSRMQTPHANSPLTSNEVSGSESTHSAPVRRTKRDPQVSAVGGSAAGSTRRTKFRRSRSGCMVCRKRKVKCDQDGLPCKQCRIGKRDCHYEDNPPKRRRKTLPHEESDAKTSDSTHSIVGGTLVQSPTASVSASSSRSSCEGSADGGQRSQGAQHAGTSTDNEQQRLQRELFRRLAEQSAAPSAGSSIVGVSHDGMAETTDEDRAKDDLLQQWARSAPLLSALNDSHVAGLDDWNSATPSTGATSLHTLDGEYGLYGSNLSSRRVTLTDEDAIESHKTKKDATPLNRAMSLPSATAGITANAVHLLPMTHLHLPGVDARGFSSLDEQKGKTIDATASHLSGFPSGLPPERD